MELFYSQFDVTDRWQMQGSVLNLAEIRVRYPKSSQTGSRLKCVLRLLAHLIIFVVLTLILICPKIIGFNFLFHWIFTVLTVKNYDEMHR